MRRLPLLMLLLLTSGSPANQNHAYEYHPALSMKCGSHNFNVSFANMLRASLSLRHVSNAADSDCITGRRLWVQFKHNRYEFFESGAGRATTSASSA